MMWISINEKMPPAGEDVLTVTITGVRTIGWTHKNGEWAEWELENTWDITHWMSLPDPPKTEV
jgi:hypothetical protein